MALFRQVSNKQMQIQKKESLTYNWLNMFKFYNNLKIYWTDNNLKIRRSREQARRRVVESSHLIDVQILWYPPTAIYTLVISQKKRSPFLVFNKPKGTSIRVHSV